MGHMQRTTRKRLPVCGGYLFGRRHRSLGHCSRRSRHLRLLQVVWSRVRSKCRLKWRHERMRATVAGGVLSVSLLQRSVASKRKVSDCSKVGMGGLSEHHLSALCREALMRSGFSVLASTRDWGGCQSPERAQDMQGCGGTATDRERGVASTTLAVACMCA